MAKDDNALRELMERWLLTHGLERRHLETVELIAKKYDNPVIQKRTGYQPNYVKNLVSEIYAILEPVTRGLHPKQKRRAVREFYNKKLEELRNPPPVSSGSDEENAVIKINVEHFFTDQTKDQEEPTPTVHPSKHSNVGLQSVRAQSFFSPSRECEIGKVIESVTQPSPKSEITVISGMSGIGKSTIADQICRDPEILRYFSGRVVALEIHKDHGPDFLDEYRHIGKMLTGGQARYDSAHAAISDLRDRLRNQPVLLVLDDVWTADQLRKFNFGITNCRILVTTRDSSIAPMGIDILIKGFDLETAVKYLQDRLVPDSGKVVDKAFVQKEIARRSMGHPQFLDLTVNIIGSGMSFEDWFNTYDTNLTELSDAIQASIKVSTDFLGKNKPWDKKLYHSLGIFQGNKSIPKSLVLDLWRHVEPERDGTLLLNKLHNMSLIELKENQIVIHDVLHAANKSAVKEIKINFHETLLEEYDPQIRKLIKGTVGSTDSDFYTYFSAHLPHHMLSTGSDRVEQFIELFDVITRRLDAQNDSQDIALENLVLNFWRGWCGQDEHRERAVDYLANEWMPRPLPKSSGTDYLSRTTAIRCTTETRSMESFGERLNTVFVDALCHSDLGVRNAALNELHLMSHQPLSEEDSEIEQALEILDELSQRSVRRKFPNIMAVKAVFAAAAMIYTNQSERTGGQNLYGPIISAVGRSLKLITTRSVFRYLGAPGRSFLVLLLLQLAKLRFEAAREVSPNNVDTLAKFFKKDADRKAQLIKALRYLDPKFRKDDDLHDLTMDLLFDSKETAEDSITKLVVETILVVRGISNPSAIEHIVKDISDHDDDRHLYLFMAVHIWYVVLDRQEQPSKITDEQLGLMEDMVKKWLCDVTNGYGALNYNQRRDSILKKGFRYFGREMNQPLRHQIYPIAYYAALSIKQSPLKNVDLLEYYVKKSLDKDDPDPNLQLHIAKSFSDFRASFNNYSGVLNALEPYMTLLDQNKALRTALVSSLGVVWREHSDEVRRFLDKFDAPAEMELEIEHESFSSSHSRKYLRFNQLLYDFFLNADSVHPTIRILEASLEKRSLGRAASKIGNELLRL